MKKYILILVSISILIIVSVFVINIISNKPLENVADSTINNNIYVAEKQIQNNIIGNNEITVENSNVEENIITNNKLEKNTNTSNKDKTVEKNEETNSKPKTTSTASTKNNENTNNKTDKSVEKNTTSSSKVTTDNQSYNNELYNNVTTNQNQKNTSKNEISSSKSEEKHTHAFTVNCGWFNSNEEAITKFNKLVDEYDLKYEQSEKTEKDWEEYIKNCPVGYEVFRCSCGMYGLNISKR